MRTFLFFTREYPELAKAESKSLARRVLEDGKGYMVAEFEDCSYNRLVMTKFAGELLYEGTSLDGLDLPEFTSFAVRCTKMGKLSSTGIEKKVGAQVKGKANLKKPETIIRVFSDGKKHFVTRQVCEYSEKALSCRKVNARPFYHPTSLQPKWARLLLNLSGVKKGKILDPFCGAGGILLEAGVIGLKAVGVDKDEAMVEGAKENLWFFRVDKQCKVEQADFFEWKGGKFDCIVTDLPYGRSSQLFGKELNVLYAQAFEKMREHSKKAVVMGPCNLTGMLDKSGWSVEKTFDFYVHKNLRRWIHEVEV